MKKFLVAALLSAFAGHAQMDDSKFILGTKLSYGHSFIYPYKNWSFHSSWGIGASSVYMFGEKAGLGVDIAYSSEGATFKSGDVKSETRLEYLRVPIRYVFTAGAAESAFRPRFTAGVAPGFALEGTDAAYRKFDLGATVTAGFQYRLTRGLWLTADADYYHGLMDVYEGNSESDMNANLRLDLGIMVGF